MTGYLSHGPPLNVQVYAKKMLTQKRFNNNLN